MDEVAHVGLGRAIHIMQEAEMDFDTALEAVGLVDGEHYERVGWDTYDCSVELYGVNDDVRLTNEQQRVIRDAGFHKAYVNHKDGWETHYSWDWRDTEFKPVRGWRRRWVTDSTASTTRSVGVPADPSNAGYYEISYWPETWGKQEGWRDTGYMRIVPDPLEVTR